MSVAEGPDLIIGDYYIQSYWPDLFLHSVSTIAAHKKVDFSCFPLSLMVAFKIILLFSIRIGFYLGVSFLRGARRIHSPKDIGMKGTPL